MVRKIGLLTAVLLLLPTSRAQTTITAGIFTFDFSLDSNNFFSATGSNTARATLQSAGNFVSNIITGTTIAAISPAGTDSWTPTYKNPSTLAGVTGTTDLTISSNSILIYAGGATNVTLGGGLGTVLAQTTQGGYASSTNGGPASASWSNALQYRGNGSYNIPWGGSMSFNSNTASWYYDSSSQPSSTVTSGTYDFYSVAVHELFHVLGFGATSGAYSATWTSLLSGTNFTGANAVSLYGSNVPLASSTDKSHWTEGISSFSAVSGATQEGMMDPTLGTGVRKYPTSLDLAAMRDLGYSTSAIPEPADYAAILSLAAVGVAMLRRRASRRANGAE